MKREAQTQIRAKAKRDPSCPETLAINVVSKVLDGLSRMLLAGGRAELSLV